ncbi:hypothetical protein [Microcella sp.]|uniref:hypothetical protein n=1 Tax=Microcella sp. TaxID=1913979 RepID=UPI00391876B8
MPQFRELLSAYRAPHEVDFYAQRMVRLSVAPEVMEAALKQGAEFSLDPEQDQLANALLAEEVARYLLVQATRVTHLRRESLEAASAARPVAEIARELGVSRQAISRLLNQPIRSSK